jgi:uncharacterized membrane protein
MDLKRVLTLLLAAGLLAGLAASSTSAIGYTKRYLEMLPGQSQSVAKAINEAGVVAGFTRDADNRMKPAYWDATGKVQALPISPEMGEGTVCSINSQGWMLGRQYSSIFDYFGQLTLWKPDGSITLFPRGDGGALNDAGLLGGALDNQAIIYNPDGTSRILPNIVPTAVIMDASVTGLNSSGVAVGICSYQIDCNKTASAVKWDANGNLTTLDGLYIQDYATIAINDRGDILDNRGKLILADGSSRQLQLPAGYTWGDTLSLNNLGQVTVRTYQGAVMLWDTDGTVAVVDTPSAGSLDYANCINDKGVIAGSVYTRDQGEVAVVWEPTVPEPGSISGLAFGLAGLAGAIYRKRR